MVKGAWARILVGKDKTRAALHEAKEKAGAGETERPSHSTRCFLSSSNTA